MKKFDYDDVIWYFPITTAMVDTLVWGSIIFALIAGVYMSNTDK